MALPRRSSPWPRRWDPATQSGRASSKRASTSARRARTATRTAMAGGRPCARMILRSRFSSSAAAACPWPSTSSTSATTSDGTIVRVTSPISCGGSARIPKAISTGKSCRCPMSRNAGSIRRFCIWRRTSRCRACATRPMILTDSFALRRRSCNSAPPARSPWTPSRRHARSFPAAPTSTGSRSILISAEGSSRSTRDLRTTLRNRSKRRARSCIRSSNGARCRMITGRTR